VRSKTPSPTPSPSSFPPRFLGGLFWRFPPALWFCQRIGVSRTRRWGRPQPPRNDVVGRARTHLDHAQCSGKVCPHIPRVPGTRVIVRPSGTASGCKHQSATAQSQHSHSTQSQHSPSHAIGHSIGLRAPISHSTVTAQSQHTVTAQSVTRHRAQHRVASTNQRPTGMDTREEVHVARGA